MENEVKTSGVHHVGLTVLDVEKSRHFFTEVLGYKVVAEKPDYPAVFVSDGTTMITLWQVENPASAVRFDRKNNIGLHHLAIGVANEQELTRLYEKLKAADDVEIEFAPEAVGGGESKHVMFTEPGGNRMELFAAA